MRDRKCNVTKKYRVAYCEEKGMLRLFVVLKTPHGDIEREVDLKRSRNKILWGRSKTAYPSGYKY